LVERSASRWVVRGRVQGVGFRRFVLRTARGLGLAGWVANQADGSVAVAAAGGPAALADLAAALSGESLVDVLSVVAKLQSSGVQRERFKSDLRKRVEAAAAKIEKRPEIVALPPEVRAHILQDVYGIVNT